MKSVYHFKTGVPSIITKEEAKEMSEILAKHLKEVLGGDWEPRTWFNTWECFNVSLGSMSVYYSTNTGTFSCYVNDVKGKTGGTPFEVFSSDQPEAAVVDAMKFAIGVLERKKEALDDNILKMTKWKKEEKAEVL